MQVRYRAVKSSPDLSLQLVGIVAIAAIFWFSSRSLPISMTIKGAVIAVFLIGALYAIRSEREVEQCERAIDHGRLLFDFQEHSFLFYRTAYDAPEEISYAEILTYYVERGSDDEYDRPRTFLGVEFRKRQSISLDVRNLDMDPQQIVSFIEHKMKWVYAQQDGGDDNRRQAK